MFARMRYFLFFHQIILQSFYMYMNIFLLMVRHPVDAYIHLAYFYSQIRIHTWVVRARADRNLTFAARSFVGFRGWSRRRLARRAHTSDQSWTRVQPVRIFCCRCRCCLSCCVGPFASLLGIDTLLKRGSPRRDSSSRCRVVVAVVIIVRDKVCPRLCIMCLVSTTW